jgi:hypothetical protein
MLLWWLWGSFRRKSKWRCPYIRSLWLPWSYQILASQWKFAVMGKTTESSRINNRRHNLTWVLIALVFDLAVLRLFLRLFYFVHEHLLLLDWLKNCGNYRLYNLIFLILNKDSKLLLSLSVLQRQKSACLNWTLCLSSLREELRFFFVLILPPGCYLCLLSISRLSNEFL